MPGSKYIICTVCLEQLLTEEIAPLPAPETETEIETEIDTETETENESSSGCNGTISASVALLALLGCFAAAWRPRKEN